ncbi:hemolytic protein HlpA-like protein [[Limnothrix rosea] IAM M-220]|nr:hemolytic protein HlpA-like protein [[Limnothrix rosea] IAM M-220]
MLKTPIVFIIFNRPDLTQIVFNEIRKAQPRQLFIIADGPRTSKEQAKCQAARDVIKQIDWDCEVFYNYSDVNLGCRERVSSGLNWIFKQVEEAIILEDDCVPNSSFFEFCEQLLVRYKMDNRIMLISGYNAQQSWQADKQDYFFSNLGGIWGWASWARAWKNFDLKMTHLDKVVKDRKLRHLLGEKLGRIRENQFLDCRSRQVDTWDYQWAYSRHINSGLAIVPSKNLIENIGFRKDATHTKHSTRRKVYSENLEFPLETNNILIPDTEYDELFFKNSESFIHKLALKLRKATNI